jgi:hypothetical protein
MEFLKSHEFETMRAKGLKEKVEAGFSWDKIGIGS